MLPAASPARLGLLDGTRWWFLFYCCLNSLVSYGLFSQALAVWPASRVSAVVATTPLFTVVFTRLAAWLWPAYIVPEALDPLSLVGAAVVVAGCVLMALRK
jgi:drug/metabolite transporter (DMT)-like permease